MRHYILISLVTLLVSALFYIIVDLVFQSTSAAIGSLTLSGLTCLVLFSAYNSDELKRERQQKTNS